MKEARLKREKCMYVSHSRAVKLKNKCILQLMSLVGSRKGQDPAVGV